MKKCPCQAAAKSFLGKIFVRGIAAPGFGAPPPRIKATLRARTTPCRSGLSGLFAKCAAGQPRARQRSRKRTWGAGWQHTGVCGGGGRFCGGVLRRPRTPASFFKVGGVLCASAIPKHTPPLNTPRHGRGPCRPKGNAPARSPSDSSIAVSASKDGRG